MNDVVVNKIQSIQRCVRRVREEYAADTDSFDTNPTRQDAAVLNILRACEQSIDLANHAIKNRKLGIPTSSGESFELLAAARGHRPRPERKIAKNGRLPQCRHASLSTNGY